jgi:hypothetical protein
MANCCLVRQDILPNFKLPFYAQKEIIEQILFYLPRMSDDDKRDITYNGALEELIASEAERCNGLSWMHGKAESFYSLRNTAVTLPTIVLSTLVGFLSGSSSSIFTEATMASIGIGSVSLFTGVLSTIGTFFSFAKKAEGHRIASIQYSKIGRFLTIELTLPRSERMIAGDLLKMTRDAIERQLETSPPIPEEIVREFKHKFKDVKNIAMPDVANGLHKVFINDRIVNSPPPTHRDEDKSSTDAVS